MKFSQFGKLFVDNRTHFGFLFVKKNSPKCNAWVNCLDDDYTKRNEANLFWTEHNWHCTCFELIGHKFVKNKYFAIGTCVRTQDIYVTYTYMFIIDEFVKRFFFSTLYTLFRTQNTKIQHRTFQIMIYKFSNTKNSNNKQQENLQIVQYTTIRETAWSNQAMKLSVRPKMANLCRVYFCVFVWFHRSLNISMYAPS